MGGQGSGTWYRFNKRDTTEEHHALDIRVWHRKGLLRPGYRFTTTWSRGERQTGSIGTGAGTSPTWCPVTRQVR